MKHKHAELIHAWADGAKIEFYRNPDWHSVSMPGWDSTAEYRIKAGNQIEPTQTQVVAPEDKTLREDVADLRVHRDTLIAELSRLRDALKGTYELSPEGRKELERIQRALDFAA